MGVYHTTGHDRNGDAFPRSSLPTTSLVNAAGTLPMAHNSEQRASDAPYHAIGDTPHDDDDAMLPDDDLAVHIASVAENKRLWWRNAVINMTFIAGWYAHSYPCVLACPDTGHMCTTRLNAPI